MKVKFWGVRGSVPTPWKDAMEYGGNTSCVQIIPSDDYQDLMHIDQAQCTYAPDISGLVLGSHCCELQCHGLPGVVCMPC